MTRALALVALLLLSGCADSSDREAPTPPTSSATIDASPLPQFDDAIAAPEALTLDTCGRTAGPQRVEGVVTGVVERADYLVTVTWVDAADEPVATGWAVVRDLADKDRADITITADVGEGAKRCIASALRGTLPCPVASARRLWLDLSRLLGDRAIWPFEWPSRWRRRRHPPGGLMRRRAGHES